MLEPFPEIKGLVEELLSSNPDSRELKRMSAVLKKAALFIATHEYAEGIDQWSTTLLIAASDHLRRLSED